MQSLVTLLSSVLLCGLLAPAAQAGSVNGLAVWSRGTGQYNDGAEPKRWKPRSFTLDEQRLTRRRLNDVQYDQKETYEGLSLKAVIALYRPQAHDDMAILHFDNGMRVPLALDDATLSRLDAFVALELCPPRGRCEKSFPEVAREDVYAVTPDPRPITFGWNKLVVPTAWHPDVPDERAAIFSPWRHVDSLSGIEFVNAAAYRAQFSYGEAAGEQVFEERCQFCHGVRQVGATHGWDFVTPLPIYEKRRPDHLLNHVKYPKVLAMKMGLMMPVQKDVTLAEMQALWRWMRRAAHRATRAYRP